MITLKWYKITLDNINKLHAKPGVYIISVLLRNGSYGAVYVGQSNDIARRIKEHFSNNEQNSSLRNYLNNDYTFKISYSYISDDLLDGIEKYLISYYHPRFNESDGVGDRKYVCSLPNVVVFD